ncbi:MAG: hypothetical protein JW751_07000 [Polyangiaceae bacterium]|nr:hypothetical protein [Polyangiaceae bacterium]
MTRSSGVQGWRWWGGLGVALALAGCGDKGGRGTTEPAQGRHGGAGPTTAGAAGIGVGGSQMAGAAGGGDVGAAGSGAGGGPGVVGEATAMGSIVDADGHPMAQVTVTQPDGGRATTDSSGHFTLAVAGSLAPTLIIRAEGYATAERHLDLDGTRVVTLPPVTLLAIAAAADVDGAVGGTVEGGGVSVVVPAGAWAREVHIEVAVISVGDPLLDDDRFPRPLPRPPGGTLGPLFGVAVDSGGAQPSVPVEITVDTAAELPAGVKVPVGRYDVESGEWVDVGLASVTTAGDLRFTTDHLSTFAGALPATPAVLVRPPELARIDELPTLTLPGEPRVDVRSGGLVIGVELPALTRRGEEVKITLFHDSRTLVASMPLPVTVTDAEPGETLLVRVGTPYAQIRAESTVTSALVTGQAATMTLPGAGAQGSMLASDPALSRATVRVARPTPGTFHESESSSFAAPTTGATLESGGAVVPTPASIAVESERAGAVPFDDRNASVFGPGWHLRGLTRLLQPRCNAERPVVLGRFDDPGKVYGPPDTYYVTSLEGALEAGGLDRAALDGEDVQVARTTTATYVTLSNAGQVWRVPEGGGEPAVLVLDLATQPELGSGVIWATTRAAHDTGAVVVSDDSVIEVHEDGTAERLTGSDPTVPAASGGDVATSYVDVPNAVAVDQNTGDLAISTYTGQNWLVRDGKLSELRTRVSHPHGLTMAFDPEGALTYTATGTPCIYRHVDGLTDPPLFPSCQSLPYDSIPVADIPPVRDGPADEAGIAFAVALSYADDGTLYLADLQGAIREVSTTGTAKVLSRVWDHAPALTRGVGGPALQADLTPFRRVSAAAPGRLAIGSIGSAAELGAPHHVLMGPGDGAVIRRQRDDTWTRELPDGTVETYDRRGLLIARGRVGEPPLEFEYADWSVVEAEEVCGSPAPTPNLLAIQLGTETLYSFTYSGDRLSTVTDAADRTTTVTWTSGQPTSFDLPGRPQAVTFRYDDGGRITSKTAGGPHGQLLEAAYVYAGARLVEVTLPGREPIAYGAVNAATEIDPGPTGITRAGRFDVARAVVPGHSGDGSVEISSSGLRVATASDEVTELELDDQGRLAAIHHADGSSLAITRDPVGRIVELYNATTREKWEYDYDRYTGRLSQRFDPTHGLSQWFWDPEGRVYLAVEPGGGRRSFVYDSSGTTSHGLPVQATDTLDRVTLLDYDEYGNLARVDVPGGAVLDVTRDRAGRVTRLVEPTGVVRTFTHDSRDGIALETWGEGAGARISACTRHATDAWTDVVPEYEASVLLGVADAAGRDWTYERDAGYRITRLVTPGDGEVLQSFDAKGLRVRRTLADGAAERLVADVNGRLERRWYEGADAGQEIRLAYDALGRVASTTDLLVRETRTYQPGIGWTQVHVAPQAGVDVLAEFTLSRSRLSATAWTQRVDGSTYTFRRGEDGIVERVTYQSDESPAERDLWSATHDTEGRTATVTRGNGTQTRFVLDAEGRISRQEEDHAGGALTIDWTWDAAGRPVRRTMGTRTRTYSYDAYGQLFGCSDSGEIYSYDAVGARASSAAGLVVRGSRGELESDATYAYVYDARGRRVERTNAIDANDRLEYEWGAQGLLAAVRTGPAGATTTLAAYRYDGTGRRIERTAGSSTWLYGYLPDTDRVVRVVAPDGDLWHLAHATDSAAFTVAVAASGSELYVHLDPLGQVTAVSDDTGQLVVLDEDCHGNRLAEPAAPLLLDIGFHGMFYDAETRLYVAGPRQYDPFGGEFLSPDPEGIAGGLAPWTYAGGNPVIQHDPSGRLLFTTLAALTVGYGIYKKIRDFAQSEEVKRARRGYERMTDLDDDALDEAEKAHENLAEASKKGGQTALEATKDAYDGVLNPAKNGGDFADMVKDQVGEAVKKAVSDSGGGGDDDSWW